MRHNFLNLHKLRQPRLRLHSYSTISAHRHFQFPQTIQKILNDTLSGESVKVSGWVKTARRQKRWVFIDLSDGTSTKPLQVVLPNTGTETIKNLATGCSVEIEGKLIVDLERGGSKEIHGEDLKIIGQCNPENYPLQKKNHGAEFLRQIGHLRPRTSAMSAVLRVRSEAEAALHYAFKRLSFTQVHTPILTSHDCEGGGEVFQVSAPQKDFFEENVYLTVSGQLHLEMAANAISRVYTLGPTFRAEPSVTGRHLSEFWMLEAEMAFITNIDSLLDLTEMVLSTATKQVLQHCQEEIHWLDDKYSQDGALKGRIDVLAHKPFSRITYTEAIAILQEAVAEGKVQFDFPPQWGRSLQSEHEQYLSERHCQGPVFVTGYPKEVKPFYMKADTKGTVACFDLLVPGAGELAGGSLREDNMEQLAANLEQAGIAEDYRWYLDLREYGGAPHGGFGLGIERYIQLLTATPHIRDITPYPRYIGTCRY